MSRRRLQAMVQRFDVPFGTQVDGSDPHAQVLYVVRIYRGRCLIADRWQNQ